MLALFALLAQDYILRDSQVRVVANYGAFRLERDECVERPGVAVLHYMSCFPKARLVWSSADGLVSIQYEDNGRALARTYRYPRRVGSPEACYVGPSYTAYRAHRAGAVDWRNDRKAFAETLARCGALDAAQLAAYEGQFATAAGGYEAAAGGLRSLARTMFHTLRRCTRFKYSPRYGGPGASASCTREEGPAT